MKDSPNFHAWNYQPLTNFATDAYAKMQEQHAEIEQLKREANDVGKRHWV